MSVLEKPSVCRVRSVLVAYLGDDPVIELANTARTAQDAATGIGCDLGAIVKSLVFMAGDVPVMALIAGDRRCRTGNLAPALGIDAKITRANADQVRSATGFAIGGVSPLALATPIPIAMDASFDRFATIYAAAGHPHCLFAITPDQLRDMTGAVLAASIAEIS